MHRSVSFANMEKKEKLVCELRKNFAPNEDKNLICFSTKMAKRLNYMPCFSALPQEFSEVVTTDFLDNTMLFELKKYQCINQWKHLSHLYPLQTLGMNICNLCA